MQKRRRTDDVQNLSENLSSQGFRGSNTDEFGGYSKTWLSKGGISSAAPQRKQSEMDDMDGIDSISLLVGLDIEQKAKELIS